MYKRKINPNKVLIWEHQNTKPELEELARQGKLHVLPPVPVFELPEKYRELGDYVLHDGHNRLEAARRANVELPIIVLTCAEDFKNLDNYNTPLWYTMNIREFNQFVNRQIRASLEYMKRNTKPANVKY